MHLPFKKVKKKCNLPDRSKPSTMIAKKAKDNVKTSTFMLKSFDKIVYKSSRFILIRHLEFPLKRSTD